MKGISHTYWPYSPDIAFSPSFDDIAEAFEKDGEDLDVEKTKEQMVGEYLHEDSLELFVKWGYLKRHGRLYKLTDLGKEAYNKNRDLCKKLLVKREK